MKIKQLFINVLLASVMVGNVSSCDKTEPKDDSKITVSATLENGRLWNKSDEVLINGAKYIVEAGEGTSTATISGVFKAESYKGAYDLGTGTLSGDKLNIQIPAVQTPSSEFAQPMVASNTNPVLSFKYVLGTLRLRLSGSATIKKIILTTSSAEKIAGQGSVNLDFGSEPFVAMSDDASGVITMELGNGLALGYEAVGVDVVLPAGNYSGFDLTIYDNDGLAMTGAHLNALQVKRGVVTESEAISYTADAEPPVYLKAGIENDCNGVQEKWTANSVIYVNGKPVSIYNGENAAEAEFGPITAADKYFASTDPVSVGSYNGTTMRVHVPAEQVYSKSCFSQNPAVAEAQGGRFDFKYVAGQGTVKVSGAHAVKFVELSSKQSNRRLAGEGVVNLTSSDFALSLNADAKRSVVLSCGSGVTADGGIVFGFILPAGDYSEGFDVKITDNNGRIFNAEIPGGKIARNQTVSLGEVVWEGENGSDNTLSAYGCSNSYMVHNEGDYSFATRHVDNTPVNGIVSADWLWASSSDLVSDVKYENGMISFHAGSERGNALIAAFNEAGEVVWSWHIWCTELPEVIDYENNTIPMSGGKTDGYFVMDRNLGATAVRGKGCEGLYYQFGRKDPFIGAEANETEYIEVEGTKQRTNVAEPFEHASNICVVNSKYSVAQWNVAQCNTEIGTLTYAQKHPMTFIYAKKLDDFSTWIDVEGPEYNSNWYYRKDESLWRPFEKTNYDPCPPGYMVPRNGVFRLLENSAAVFVSNEGVECRVKEGVTTWIPYNGSRSAHTADMGRLCNMNDMDGTAQLWSSELSTKSLANILFVHSPLIDNMTAENSWNTGNGVRCVREYSE